MGLVRKTIVSITGSETIDGPEYEVVWKVTTDTVNDGPFTVRGYVGVAYGDQYTYKNDSDPLARCTRISERPMGSSKVDWEVTLNYTRPPREEAGERSASDNPINDPIQVEWGYEERQRTTLVDIHGNPIVNPCGDPYDELIVVDDFRRTLTIVRNEKSFPRALADALSNKVNDAPWNSYAAKCVKIKPITAVRNWNTAIGQYFSVRYEFVMSGIDETWETELVSKGFHHYTTAGNANTKQRIYLPYPDQAGIESEPAVEAQLLLGDGTLWADGDPVHTRKWETIYLADFSQLNLDNVV